MSHQIESKLAFEQKVTGQRLPEVVKPSPAGPQVPPTLDGDPQEGPPAAPPGGQPRAAARRLDTAPQSWGPSAARNRAVRLENAGPPCPALPRPSSSSAESGRAPPAGLVTEGRASCSPRGEEGTGLKKVQSLLQAGPSGHLQAGSRVGGGWPRRPGWWVGSVCPALGLSSPDNLTQETCRPSDSVKSETKPGHKEADWPWLLSPLQQPARSRASPRGCRRELGQEARPGGWRPIPGALEVPTA